MAARNRKEEVARPTLPRNEHAIEPALLTKRKLPIDAMHLNLRLSGESAQIYRYLEKWTPGITDSLRLRDCIRVAAFLIAMKERGTPVRLSAEDGGEELLEHIGAFYPQSAMDTRKRTKAD